MKFSNSPGTLYHVIQKGVAEAPIFREKAAREFYLARLGLIARAEGVLVLGFAIMDTHVHLILFVPRSLERVMRRLGTSFGLYYNRRHKRKGHVFGRKFFAREIEGEDDFRRTLRYVLRNPAKARLHRTEGDLLRSDRTSYPSLVGDSHLFAADAAIALRYFGSDPRAARAELLHWLTMTNDDFECVPELREWQTGADDETSARRDSARAAAERAEAKRAALLSSGWSLETVATHVASRLGVSIDAIRTRSKVPPLPRARAMIAHLASEDLGFSLVTIASWLGLDPSTVQRSLVRGKASVENDGIVLAVTEAPGEIQSND